MTPQEFLDTIVRPTVGDAKAEPLSLRKMICAVATTDMLAAVIYDSRKGIETLVLSDGNLVSNDSSYRTYLGERSETFGLLHDIANAHKHILLTKKRRRLTSASQIKPMSLGFGVGRYGEGPYGGTEQIVVEADDGSIRNVSALVSEAVAFLEGEIRRLPGEG